MKAHKIRIVTQGWQVRFYIDGQELQGVRGYHIDQSAGQPRFITLEIYPDEIELITDEINHPSWNERISKPPEKVS